MASPLSSSQPTAKQKRTYLETASSILCLLGASLAIAGALAPWFTISGGGSVGETSVGLLQVCSKQPLTGYVDCALSTSLPTVVGAALLLLGFIFGLFGFFASTLRFCRQELAARPSCASTRFGFVAGSFIFSLIGTCISAAVKSIGGLSFAQAVEVAKTSWGPAFGCSVAAVLFQFFAFAIALSGIIIKHVEEPPQEEADDVATHFGGAKGIIINGAGASGAL